LFLNEGFMILTLFWLKIALKRIIFLVKSSALMFIWVFIIIGAFAYAVLNGYFIINPDITLMYNIFLFLFLCSIISSFRSFNYKIELIRFSMSHYSNNKIIFRFFLNKAIKNNLILLLLCALSFNFVPDILYFFVFMAIAAFSVVLSFLIMLIKHKYSDKLKYKKADKIVKKLKFLNNFHINPYIKSIFYDYLTIDFTAVIVICYGAGFAFIAEFIKYKDLFINSDNRFFIFFLIIFSFGFLGVIDSVACINWKFHAMLSKNSLLHHYSRTLIFFAFIYGLLFIAFIIIGRAVNPLSLIKYIFCVFINMVFSINISFSAGNKLIKGIILIFLMAITVYISALRAVFLAGLLIPAAITLVKAKNDIREWSLS